MTNKEILDVFTERYPNVSVNDYRPIADMYMPKGRQGITIWTDTNDVILFFPCTDGADNCPLHEVQPDPDTVVAKNRYKDLCNYFGNDPDSIRGILEDGEQFNNWLERMYWHVKECDRLSRLLNARENSADTDTVSRPQGHWIEDGYYGLPCVCSYCGHE